jgi:hypothetical protein
MSAAKRTAAAAAAKSTTVVMDEDDDEVASPEEEEAGAAEAPLLPPAPPPKPVPIPRPAAGARQVARLTLLPGVTVPIGREEVSGTWRNILPNGRSSGWTCVPEIDDVLGPVLVFYPPVTNTTRTDSVQRVSLSAVASWEYAQ